MSDDRRSDLLLAALQRAGEALDSDELLAQATELALDYLWTPDHLVGLNRKSVSKRCRDMVDSGVLQVHGLGMDSTARRPAPKYAPVAGFDAAAPVPKPPAIAPTQTATSPYASMDRTQLLAVLEAHDDVGECVARFMADLSTVREKVRRRLLAVGLGER